MGVTSLVTELKNNRWNKVFFFSCWDEFRKLNVYSIIFVWAWSKMVIAFSSRDSKICCTLSTNL